MKLKNGQRRWDHAFASGAAVTEPGKGGFLSNLLFSMIEWWFSEYYSRKIWTAFRENAVLGKDVRIGNNARIINRNRRDAVVIGNNAVCRGIIRIEKHGELLIGDEVYIGDNVIISAAEKITIGEGTLLAHGVQLFDNTTHPTHWEERRRHFSMLLGIAPKGELTIPKAQIIIGKNCWIGMNSMILKGVSIGDRSIVGAGCVVTNDVPSDTLIGGAGQRELKKLVSEDASI
ncbi:MAG: acyltransferase [Nitrospirae bacterium]|nr:acyltransferase [Nitrospirota bacterium]